MDLGLKGRVALVCGASAGLGRASAAALAREGAVVELCSRDRKRAAAAAAALAAETGGEVRGTAADVEDPAACRRWVEGVVKRRGRLDILVHNAGGPPEGSFAELSEAAWEEGWRRSFLSATRMVRLAVPAMRRARWGRLVFIASTSAKQPIPGLAVSNALRAGILGLSKTLSAEFGPDGILANAVLPGYTTTERLEELARAVAAKAGKTPAAVKKGWEASVPLRRLAEPAEVGSVVAFLCSERASYVTGTALAVDGGRIASPF